MAALILLIALAVVAALTFIAGAYFVGGLGVALLAASISCTLAATGLLKGIRE